MYKKVWKTYLPSNICHKQSYLSEQTANSNTMSVLPFSYKSKVAHLVHVGNECHIITPVFSRTTSCWHVFHLLLVSLFRESIFPLNHINFKIVQLPSSEMSFQFRMCKKTKSKIDSWYCRSYSFRAVVFQRIALRERADGR